MKGALDVHRTLLSQGVPHEVVRLPARVLTADDLPGVLQLERGCVAVRCYAVDRPAGREHVAVLVAAGSWPDEDALADALGAAELHASGPHEVNAVTDFAAGLVSPVGLPRQVAVLADSALGASDVSYCAVGEGGVALGIRTRDLLLATGARVASLEGGPDGRAGLRAAHAEV